VVYRFFAINNHRLAPSPAPTHPPTTNVPVSFWTKYYLGPSAVNGGEHARPGDAVTSRRNGRQRLRASARAVNRSRRPASVNGLPRRPPENPSRGLLACSRQPLRPHTIRRKYRTEKDKKKKIIETQKYVVTQIRVVVLHAVVVLTAVRWRAHTNRLPVRSVAGGDNNNRGGQLAQQLDTGNHLPRWFHSRNNRTLYHERVKTERIKKIQTISRSRVRLGIFHVRPSPTAMRKHHVPRRRDNVTRHYTNWEILFTAVIMLIINRFRNNDQL
jgi:hypothetical protein